MHIMLNDNIRHAQVDAAEQILIDFCLLLPDVYTGNTDAYCQCAPTSPFSKIRTTVGASVDSFNFRIWE